MGVPIPEKYRVDLNGKIIDQLTVIKERDPNQAFNGSKEWLCKCECGREVTRTTKVLITKTDVSKPKSCGMCHKCQPIGTRIKDRYLEIIGTEDGRIYYDRGEEIKYIVKCHNCGSISILNYRDFRNKIYCSNCSHDDRWSKVRETNTKHGNAKGGIRTKLNHHFHNLHIKASKGKIKICKEWNKDNFLIFKKWADSHGYRDDIRMSIYIKDPTKEVSPDNCEWVTYEHALKYQSNNVFIDGKIITDWSIERMISTSEIADMRALIDNDEEFIDWLHSLPYRSQHRLIVTDYQIPAKDLDNYLSQLRNI